MMDTAFLRERTPLGREATTSGAGIYTRELRNLRNGMDQALFEITKTGVPSNAILLLGWKGDGIHIWVSDTRIKD